MKSDGVFGLDQVLKKLGMAGRAYENAAEAAIYGQWVALFELVNRKMMVPVHTGALKASNYVSDPVRSGGKITVEAGYGQPYAAEVHERQSQQGHGRGRYGYYKWLQRGVDIHKASLPIRLAEATMKAYTSGIDYRSLRGVFPSSPRKFDLSTKAGQREFKYAAKYGMTREQRKLLRGAAKAGGVKLVRRWKTPKRGVPRVAMYPKGAK